MKARILRKEEPCRLPLPRIGRIKIGMRNAKGLPQSVDYFVAVGKYAGLFAEAYGPRPSTIQVVFPDDDPHKVCNEQYEYRDDKGRLIAKGDGELFDVWNGNGYVSMSVDQYPTLMQSIARRYPNSDVKRGGDGWRVRLTLNFIIPMVRGVVGVWTFETSGTASTIPQIRDAFDYVQEQRDGKVSGVIFDLSVAFAQSQKPDSASRFAVVSLIPNESEQNIRNIQNAYKPIKLLENGTD